MALTFVTLSLSFGKVAHIHPSEKTTQNNSKRAFDFKIRKYEKSESACDE